MLMKHALRGRGPMARGTIAEAFHFCGGTDRTWGNLGNLGNTRRRGPVQ